MLGRNQMWYTVDGMNVVVIIIIIIMLQLPLLPFLPSSIEAVHTLIIHVITLLCVHSAM